MENLHDKYNKQEGDSSDGKKRPSIEIIDFNGVSMPGFAVTVI